MDYKEITNVATRERELEMSAAFPVLMRKVYLWMTLALVITGFTAYYVASSETLITAIMTNQILFWGLVIGELALVFGLSAAINKLSLTTATLMFVLYSVINGATLSFIFLVYTYSSITNVFFITAGTFAVMALFGYFTKTDLTSIGKILMMALIGIIIATIVNFFTKSEGLAVILNYLLIADDIHLGFNRVCNRADIGRYGLVFRGMPCKRYARIPRDYHCKHYRENLCCLFT